MRALRSSDDFREMDQIWTVGSQFMELDDGSGLRTVGEEIPDCKLPFIYIVLGLLGWHFCVCSNLHVET